jgi:hypothetical protein
MPKITSDVSNTSPFSAVPKNFYPARIHSATFGKSKLKEDGTGDNPMLTFGFTIENNAEAPQYNNRQVNFYNVVTSGLDKNGAPVNINRVIEVISATGIPWDHSSCNALGITNSPIEDKKNGIFLCPECHESLSKPGSQISYDSDDFVNRHVKIQVNVRKRLGTDEDQNEVQRVMRLS